ncbi:MAG: hypothetical protein ACRC0L_00675, partial [Angustibacter sp.]
NPAGAVFGFNRYIKDANGNLVAEVIPDLTAPNAAEQIVSVDISLSAKSGAGPSAVPASTVKNRVLITNTFTKTEVPSNYGCVPPACSQNQNNNPPPNIGNPQPPPPGFPA